MCYAAVPLSLLSMKCRELSLAHGILISERTLKWRTHLTLCIICTLISCFEFAISVCYSQRIDRSLYPVRLTELSLSILNWAGVVWLLHLGFKKRGTPASGDLVSQLQFIVYEWLLLSVFAVFRLVAAAIELSRNRKRVLTVSVDILWLDLSTAAIVITNTIVLIYSTRHQDHYRENGNQAQCGAAAAGSKFAHEDSDVSAPVSYGVFAPHCL